MSRSSALLFVTGLVEGADMGTRRHTPMQAGVESLVVWTFKGSGVFADRRRKWEQTGLQLNARQTWRSQKRLQQDMR